MKVAIVILCTFVSTFAWDYASQGADWPASDPTPEGSPVAYCDGDRQSPIDLNSDKTIKYDGSEFVAFSMNYCEDLSGYFFNNGHTIQFGLDQNSGVATASQTPSTNYITGGPLGTAKYYFWQYHFHWGTSGAEVEKGSEHTVDGNQMPGEVHLVHVHEDYVAAIGGALTDPKGLAVLGMFIVGGADATKDTSWFEPIEIALDDFSLDGTYAEQIATFPSNDTMNLNKMVQKINPGYGAAFNYWHYEGGLTTPTCNEVANFIIAEHPLQITDTQIVKFWELYDSAGVNLISTYREVQPDNCRKVSYIRQNEESAYDYSSFPAGDSPSWAG